MQIRAIICKYVNSSRLFPRLSPFYPLPLLSLYPSLLLLVHIIPPLVCLWTNVALVGVYYKATPLGPLLQAAVSPYAPSLCFDASFLIILLSPKHIFSLLHFFFFFSFTLIHLFSLGRLRHGLFELHVLIVVGNLMPGDLLFSSPLLSLPHPGGVLNGNTLLWITQQGAPWLIALLTIY